MIESRQELPSRQKCANPLLRVKPAVIADDSKAQQITRLHRSIMAELVELHSPFITPEQIAPRLGLKPNSFRVYCRATKSLRHWQGSYRFMKDDPQHLKALGMLCCWRSGR